MSADQTTIRDVLALIERDWRGHGYSGLLKEPPMRIMVDPWARLYLAVQGMAPAETVPAGEQA